MLESRVGPGNKAEVHVPLVLAELEQHCMWTRTV